MVDCLELRRGYLKVAMTVFLKAVKMALPKVDAMAAVWADGTAGMKAALRDEQMVALTVDVLVVATASTTAGWKEQLRDKN